MDADEVVGELLAAIRCPGIPGPDDDLLLMERIKVRLLYVDMKVASCAPLGPRGWLIRIPRHLDQAAERRARLEELMHCVAIQYRLELESNPTGSLSQMARSVGRNDIRSEGVVGRLIRAWKVPLHVICRRVHELDEVQAESGLTPAEWMRRMEEAGFH